MLTGVNVGYSSTKAIRKGQRVLFPSAVVPYSETHFAINEAEDIVIEDAAGSRWLVGQEAVLKSALEASPYEDRDWIMTDDYRRLWEAALTQLTRSTRMDMQVVTGLPIGYYRTDKGTLAEMLQGEHRITRADRKKRQIITVTDTVVLPEQFGTLFSVCLDSDGKIIPLTLGDGRVIDIETAHIGIIDPGGGTTGFLRVGPNLKELPNESFIIEEGCWDVMRNLERLLDEQFPRLGLRNYEVAAAAEAGQITYFGEVHDIRPLIYTASDRLVKAIISAASQQWRIGTRIALIVVILLSGGGALLIGKHPRMQEKFPQMVVVPDPVMANALGFLHFAHRLWGQKE